jgi:tetratricopeptide (TPR) repeat protein
VEARVEYAGASTEAGDPDQAIRELLEAVRLEPKNDSIFSFLARAYLDKGVWDRAIEYSDQSLSLKTTNSQAYLWRAEAYRRLAASDKTNRQENYLLANDDFHRFLRLTDFSTPTGSAVLFYLFGFGQGSRNHADRSGAYEAFRATGLIGACICSDKLGNLQSALAYCKNAVNIDKRDATAQFFLGNVYRDMFNQALDADAPNCEYLISAHDHYAEAVSINPDLHESVMAKTIMADITRVAPTLHCQMRTN